MDLSNLTNCSILFLRKVAHMFNCANCIGLNKKCIMDMITLKKEENVPWQNPTSKRKKRTKK